MNRTIVNELSNSPGLEKGDRTLDERCVRLMLSLFSEDKRETAALKKELRLSEDDFRSLLLTLQTDQFVERGISSNINGFAETVRLTKLGESVLVNSLAVMCELPEWDCSDIRTRISLPSF